METNIVSILTVLLTIVFSSPAGSVVVHGFSLRMWALSIVGATGVIGTALAWLPGKLGAFFAALGKDAAKLRALGGDAAPPTPPAPPSDVVTSAQTPLSRVLPPVLPVLAFVLAFVGCGGGSGANAPTSRDTARGVLLVAANGVKVAAEACVTFAAGDATKLAKCQVLYSDARGALLVAEASIDAWSSASAGAWLCAVSKVAPAIVALNDAARANGIAVSPSALDAETLIGGLASSLSGTCAADASDASDASTDVAIEGGAG